MRIVLLMAVFFAAFQQVFAAGQTVAVLPSDGVLSQDELEFLTDKAQEIAVRVLPKSGFEVFPQEVVIKRLGGADSYVKECKEISCIVELGRKASVDYVAQCRFGKLGSDLRITFELYNVRTSGLIDKFSETAKNINGLLAIMEKKIPEGFMKIPGAASKTKTVPPSVAGGISGLQSGTDDEFDVEQSYLANFATEPAGAVLSFNGIPAANCTKTPCSVELAEGSVRIIAVLDQYETADTTVSIKRNNQNLNIKLKPNFGVLEIKPAYSEGIGKNENWSLTINGKATSSWENRLSPGKYGVKLTHRCYEDISFNVGINKGKHEVFDMGSNVKPKKGGLALSAEKIGKPVSEPVFINGYRVGETPFSGSVAMCSEIEIGAGKEKVNVKLEHKQTVRYVHKIQSGGVSGGVLTDSRDGKKYRIVKIGRQTWMAENLNYNASDSECYENRPENCTKYGRLYYWYAAKEACPKGWHLPSDEEWQTLVDFAGGNEVAGKKLKAKSGWNQKGNGTDEFGFSALPGGYYGSGGDFSYVGDNGFWWSASEYSSYGAYSRIMDYDYGNVRWDGYNKSYFFSVRCVQDDGKNDSNNGSGSTSKKAKGSLKAPNARDIDMDNEDSRSKAEIIAVVNARMPGLKNTYNKYLKFKPDFSGNVTLEFTIAPGGDIIKISILSSTTDHANFDNAVKNMVATWKWKAIKSGNTKVSMPFDFE